VKKECALEDSAQLAPDCSFFLLAPAGDVVCHEIRPRM
jgi:hypothetical protein